jgi:hypothetical protein
MKAAWAVWAALFFILITYVAAVVRLHPTNFFGLFEDDSIYFSSAKALAQGQGYVLPSVPGTPPATKYPILYPLILSLVWRWNPSFPENLAGAVGVTVVFGIAYIIAGFYFLRRLQVFNDIETIVLTAFCALHPLVLFISGNVLSDIPFAALALVAIVLADRSLEPGAKPVLGVICGIVAGLSMTMRVFGVPVVAGILVAAMLKHAWKKMFAFAACVLPFFLVIVWRNIFSAPIPIPVSGISASSLGWLRAWAYYTNYVAIWKFGVPNANIFWAMVRNNLGLVVQAPADLFLSPLLVSDTIVGRALVLLVSSLTFAGTFRQGLARGWQAVHHILPFFVVLILCWNYSDAGNRFLLPFYFLFVAGFWIEIKHMLVMLRRAFFGQSSAASEKVLAVALGVGILSLAVGTGFNYAFGRRGEVYALSQQRGEILKSKQEAYRWLNQGIADGGCCTPVIAVEDANLYLYSGRTAMSPVLTFPSSTLYQEYYLNESVDHLMDVAKALKATLWFFAEDDFNMESKDVAATIRHCLGAGGPTDWPEVFRSSDGRVVIRSLYDTRYPSPCQTLLAPKTHSK